MNNNTRVVVTGLGTVNPVGNDVSTTWDRILKGVSGIERVRAFNPDEFGFKSQVAGEVKDFDYPEHYPESFRGKAKRMERFVHFAQASLNEALKNAGLSTSEFNERVGIILGTGIGGMNTNREQAKIFFNKGAKRISPFYIPAFIGNMAAGFLSIVNGIKGPNVSIQTACTSANHAISMAKMIIQSGMADVIISGGTEAIVEPLTIAGFDNMKALSSSFNNAPATSSRPYDKSRDGFVMAEGSAVLILESLEHAQKRNANILCEIVANGMSGDAYDIVMPCSDGDGAYRSMISAVKQAGINAEELNYINAHGTSTPLGDLAETQAINRMMNNKKSGYHVGSTKSMTGHLIGAASAIEAVVSVLAIKHQVIPANINIFDFDEKTELTKDIINTEVIKTKVKYVMSNSFGFGGHNCSLIFKEFG